MFTLPRESVLPVLQTVSQQEALPVCALVMPELAESMKLMSHCHVWVSTINKVHMIRVNWKWKSSSNCNAQSIIDTFSSTVCNNMVCIICFTHYNASYKVRFSLQLTSFCDFQNSTSKCLVFWLFLLCVVMLYTVLCIVVFYSLPWSSRSTHPC